MVPRLPYLGALLLAAVACPLVPATYAAASAPSYQTYSAAAITLSGGQHVAGALELDTHRTASRLSLMPAADTMVVVARGGGCAGAPKLTVQLDASQAHTLPVSSRTWKHYAIALPVRPGVHRISVRLTNPHGSRPFCRRRLWLKTVSFTSQTAIDTGTPGSVCEPSDGGLPYVPLEPGTSDTFLGRQPHYYETGAPDGPYRGRQPRGVAMVIHGGGWYVVGVPAVINARSEADRWRALGWTTVNIDYPACSPAALTTLARWFDLLHSAFPDLPICTDGGSAGGELALLLAAVRPVSCAVNQDGPTDLPGLSTGAAFDPATGGTQTHGPEWAYQLAVAAFGAGHLESMSPVSHLPLSPDFRVLQAFAESDPFIPAAQALKEQTLLRSDAGDEVLFMPAGNQPWVHADVSAPALAEYQVRLTALATEVGTAPTSSTPSP